MEKRILRSGVWLVRVLQCKRESLRRMALADCPFAGAAKSGNRRFDLDAITIRGSFFKLG